MGFNPVFRSNRKKNLCNSSSLGMQTFVVGRVSARQNESGRAENFTFCHILQHKYLGCAVRIVLTILSLFIKSENCFCVRSMTSCLSRGHWNTPFCKRLESRTKPSLSQTRPFINRRVLPQNRKRISVCMGFGACLAHFRDVHKWNW